MIRENDKNGRVFDVSVELKDNAMLKIRPELFDEWDFVKNDELGLDVYKVSYGRSTKTWWICRKCDSSYDISPKLRILQNQNCPFCRGLRVNYTNSLASLNPKLASLWHPIKNGIKTPHDITLGSNKKAWLICDKCDSEFLTKIADIKNSNGCPYCCGAKVNHTNSLATLNPELAAQWHPTKNGKLTPHDVTCNNSKKLWWLCECGHEWNAIVSNRNRDCGCPYCGSKKVLIGFNDIWTTNPELCYLLDNPSDGYKYSLRSNVKVDWRCLDCKEVIRNKAIADVSRRKLSCPNCSDKIPQTEKFFFQFLRYLNIEFDYQKSFDWSDGKIYDFYFNGHLVEVHGDQHYGSSFESVGGRTLQEEKENDKYKFELAVKNGVDKYIVIDARISEPEYIKASIINSELSNMFDLTCIDWNLINMNSQKSLNLEILRLWNDENMSVSEIVKTTKLHSSTIVKTLKNFHSLKMCVYDSYRGRKKLRKI